ncbi:DedA family protein [Lacisediminihabitans sp.]|uniref:DedA family protein n=1 Tax=Lacisediminihabitans sp. TaxID=2787631 RepID=UPI00374CF6B3
MADVAGLIYAVAQSPWALGALVGLLVIDGFFPLVPGETMVVTLAALGASGHGPDPVAVLVVATAATMVGDGIAFLIGRSIHPARWVWMRGSKAQTGLLWASGRIERNPGAILVGAKFLPFVRVAVTMTAGASDLPVWRYLVFSLLSATVYTAYHVGVAVTAGGLFIANPFVGLAASIAFGLLSATVIAGIHRIVTGRAERARTAASGEFPSKSR